ncbi:MAG: hypothetical protein ACTTJM_01780 [Bergeyella cardium]
MYKILFTAIVLSILSCTSHKKEILIDKQEILYDSTKINDKSFKITIITTLKYKNNINLTSKDLEGFYMLVDKDTLDLKMESIQQFTNGSLTKAEYITSLKHREKEYDNISFVNRVENWQIKNRNTNIISRKSSNYKIISLIALWENDNPNEIE